VDIGTSSGMLSGFSEAIAAAFARKADWPSAVAAAVGAALDFAALHPSAARLLPASSEPLADPQLGRSGLLIQRALIGVLHEGAMSHPGADTSSGLAERAAVGAALSVLAASLAEGEVDSLIG
jgi:hypothetical protein